MNRLHYLLGFFIGGFGYNIIEICMRGYSHWTMTLVGGACYLVIGMLNEFSFQWGGSIFMQSLAGAVIITSAELLCGIICNLYLGWNIWDYSHLPYNILGQIALWPTVRWFFLSTAIIFIDDFLRNKLLGEPYGKYRF